jgi:hypothetical protein
MGLANAPLLGGTTLADPRVHDAIANGPDSCGRKLDPGPLRYRVIPCQRASPSPGPSAPGASSSSPNDSLVMLWVEHYDAHWGCPRRGDGHSGPSLGAATITHPFVASNAELTGYSAAAFAIQCPGMEGPR